MPEILQQRKIANVSVLWGKGENRMTKVKIPFLPKFKEPMLNGTKTITSRRKRYGNVGDFFDAFGAIFQLTEVFTLALGDIASFWEEEGCQSLDDFVETWKQIHPNARYRLSDRFYVHKFKKIGEAK
jgi:uncharacterized protein YqfB (UPF0267 family)